MKTKNVRVKMKIETELVSAKKGITLIALVITIILMLILSGVVISLIIGKNGLFNTAEYAVQKNNEKAAREKIELVLLDARTQKEANLEYNNIAFLDNMLKRDNIKVNGDVVEADGYKFIIDREELVIVEGLKNLTISYEVKTINEDDITISVKIEYETGTVKQIECPNGDIVYPNNENKVIIDYDIIPNTDYEFIITNIAGNKIKKIIRKDYTDGLLQQINQLTDTGDITLQVSGTTAEKIYETIDYSINSIIYNGDILLDGINTYEGATLSNNVYTFGSSKDIGNSTILLKVNGNLTINNNVSLTTVMDSKNGPKGLIVYCTGILTNNGAISMNTRSAYTAGQNIYLFKNKSTGYEIINASGRPSRSKKRW